jgi:hypothetical protein
MKDSRSFKDVVESKTIHPDGAGRVRRRSIDKKGGQMNDPIDPMVPDHTKQVGHVADIPFHHSNLRHFPVA